MRTAAFRLSELRAEINQAQMAGGKSREELQPLYEQLLQTEERYRQELQDEAPPHPTDQPGGHGAEVRALLGRAELRNYIGAAIQSRAVDGAEAELSAALETRTAENGGVMLPWELLDPGPPPEARAEHRADVATTLGASSGIGTVQDMIIQRVFAQTAAMFLGVQMKGVGVGQHSFPIITDGQTADLKAAGAEHDATAATIGASVLEPRRLTARYLIRVEDIAKLTGYEEALRQDLNGAMGERLDHFVLNGDDATAPQWSGFFDALTDPTAPNAKSTYADFLAAYGGGVDGRYATMLTEVKLLVGAQTYGLAASVTNAGSGATAVQYAQDSTGGLRGSALVPDPASNIPAGHLGKAWAWDGR